MNRDSAAEHTSNTQYNSLLIFYFCSCFFFFSSLQELHQSINSTISSFVPDCSMTRKHIQLQVFQKMDVIRVLFPVTVSRPREPLSRSCCVIVWQLQVWTGSVGLRRTSSESMCRWKERHGYRKTKQRPTPH